MFNLKKMGAALGRQTGGAQTPDKRSAGRILDLVTIGAIVLFTALGWKWVFVNTAALHSEGRTLSAALNIMACTLVFAGIPIALRRTLALQASIFATIGLITIFILQSGVESGAAPPKRADKEALVSENAAPKPNAFSPAPAPSPEAAFLPAGAPPEGAPGPAEAGAGADEAPDLYAPIVVSQALTASGLQELVGELRARPLAPPPASGKAEGLEAFARDCLKPAQATLDLFRAFQIEESVAAMPKGLRDPALRAKKKPVGVFREEIRAAQPAIKSVAPPICFNKEQIEAEYAVSIDALVKQKLAERRRFARGLKGKIVTQHFCAKEAGCLSQALEIEGSQQGARFWLGRSLPFKDGACAKPEAGLSKCGCSFTAQCFEIPGSYVGLYAGSTRFTAETCGADALCTALAALGLIRF